MKGITYIKDLYKDEIRNGFLVTSNRKKIWQKELEILHVIDNICRKYDIQYFADFGTLLGAVRHGGFVPWDDDIDITMMRPDYERFQEVITKEIDSPYIFRSNYNCSKILPFCKVMDERTSAIEHPNELDLPQGIFVDIFPMDAMKNGSIKMERIIRIADELWTMAINPMFLINMLKNDEYALAMNYNTMLEINKLPLNDRLKQYEIFMLNHFNDSDEIGVHVLYNDQTHYKNLKKEWYSDVCVLPFEGIQLPVPIGYEHVLESYYGDWHKFVKGATLHEGIIMSSDIPYKYYLENISD